MMLFAVLAHGDDWHRVADFSGYGELLPRAGDALLVAAVLGLVGGLISVFVIKRDLPFAVHGISELSFAGAGAALLLGVSVVVGSIVGSLVAAALIGVLGVRARDRNSVIGVLMPFGLGLGVLFESLYRGDAESKFALLVGEIATVDQPDVIALVMVSAAVLIGIMAIWRPLDFASSDPEVAAARGVPVGILSVAFMALLGLQIAMSVQVVGALLVLSIITTPAAAAMRITASPRAVVGYSMAFGFIAMEGGMLLALGADVPISPYVTTISFLIYLVCRAVGSRRATPRRRRLMTAQVTDS